MTLDAEWVERLDASVEGFMRETRESPTQPDGRRVVTMASSIYLAIVHDLILTAQASSKNREPCARKFSEIARKHGLRQNNERLFARWYGMLTETI